MVSTPLPRGGMTALLLAAREGAVAGARALIEAGADLNLTDPDGTTPLVMAIINRHNDVAALLIEKGRQPDAADTAGMTALYAAVDLRQLGPLINRPTPKATGETDNLDLVSMLLERGAKIRTRACGCRSCRASTTPAMRSWATAPRRSCGRPRRATSP